MIDRYHLRYFLAVIDRGNFSRAADACNVSQPTLSVGIAKLEKALGKPLFLRSNRRVELTEAGTLLAEQARRIEAGFLAAERAVGESAMVETVRLGVVGTIAPDWIDRLLRAHRLAGGGRLELYEGRERELSDRLASGRIDAALTIVRAGTGPHDVIVKEGYAMALPPFHPLAGRTHVAAEELAGEPMIVRRHCEALADTSRHFTTYGVRPFFAARTASDERALRYVREGLGVTLVPESYAGAGLACPRLDGFDLTRTLGLVYAPHIDRVRLAGGALARAIAQLGQFSG
ncbi:LysR family transcriptional regulator [Sphingomonas sp. Mn802worker]|uniref:LysR family transcriptional regulator n=1 Tax=Sphingomonas sp. Mn802worker TaxID=629773 RepID=UPI000370DF95|nr:LysR family transcriptional regulator [Sphingomonas sp. Mn802worker]